MKNLLDLTFEKLEKALLDHGEKSFRALQIFDWVYKKGTYSFDGMLNLPKKLRTGLGEAFGIQLPDIVEKLTSKADGTVKYLLRLNDGNVIESVLMTYKHGHSICISSQVGCRMGCVFCASTGLGLIRDLAPGEFTGQVIAVERDLGIRISNITVMGIGEPLDNYFNLMDFVSIICDKRGKDISARSITVSTCGLPERIYQLADTGIKINLALSLHSADDAIRSKLMPAAKKYTVDELIKAMGYHFEKTGRRPTYEYTLIKNVNDSREDALLLAKKLKGSICHVNLIMLTETGHGEMERPDGQTIMEFSNVLNKYGIEVTIRRRLGEDINAACGQLRRSRGNK